MLKQIGFLCLLLSFGGLALAQDEPGRQVEVPSLHRIIDRPITGPPVSKVVDALLFPFAKFGNAFERGLMRVEEDHLRERAVDLQRFLLEKGYQPLFGGLGTGAGFALGVNIFRESFLGSGIRLDVPLQFSTNRYASLGLSFTFPVIAKDRLFLKTSFEYQDRPQEDFFGLGALSSKTDRTNFDLERRMLEVTLGTRLSKNLILGFPFSVSNANVFRGRDDRFPDLQNRFDPARIPGAPEGAELFSVGGFLEWDFRDQPADPAKGGWVRLAASYFQDTESQDFRFSRYRLESAYYVPLSDVHVLAFRGLALFNDEKGRSAVPFFHKAVLGGKETMRGFREFRFYDDNALLLSAEYRWEIWKFADAALFVDEGQVAPEPGDFSISDFRNSHGIGVRFKSATSELFRIDVGHSNEGWRVYVSFAPTF